MITFRFYLIFADLTQKENGIVAPPAIPQQHIFILAYWLIPVNLTKGEYPEQPGGGDIIHRPKYIEREQS